MKKINLSDFVQGSLGEFKLVHRRACSICFIICKYHIVTDNYFFTSFDLKNSIVGDSSTPIPV